MAGCSPSTAAPFESVAEILRKLQTLGFCSDLDVSPKEPPGGENNLSYLFDQILSVFLNEICYRRGEIRPLPAVLGDGLSVDLFKLYSVVQGKGGYDAVSDAHAWPSVAEAIGFESGIGSSLKLVFFKYLDALDQCLQRGSAEKPTRERTGYTNPSSLVTRCGSRGTANHKKDCDCNSRMPPSTSKDQCSTPFSDVGSDSDDVVILEDIANGGFNHHKRKRNDLAGMLGWVRKLAKSPADHPYIAKAWPSDKGKGKTYAAGEFYALAILSRQAMFFRRIRRTNPNQLHLQVLDEEQKIHTSVYGNGFGSTNQVKATEINLGLQTAGWLSRDQQWALRPVGARFQAQVPNWTSQPTVLSIDSDTLKWLGKRTWPPENQERSPVLDYASIGRGRPNTCQCEWPGSVECIRFHIAEKRLQLKCEIGTTFHAWKCESMGEEVALSWTEEEEKKFRDIVIQNRPSLNKNFWDQLYLNFPYKQRESLVRYYFNVFLIGRRRYQNHVTPKHIDSDDEETEIGFLSNSFGHDVKICDSKSILCAQNQQCMDIDR
ncbi:unnamed protein product [Musa textilis]